MSATEGDFIAILTINVYSTLKEADCEIVEECVKELNFYYVQQFLLRAELDIMVNTDFEDVLEDISQNTDIT